MKPYLMLLLISVPLLLAPGCGGDEKDSSSSDDAAAKGSTSEGTVARIGETLVTTADVARTQPAIAPDLSTDGSGRAKPPLFDDCVEASRKSGQNGATEALRQSCRKLHRVNTLYAVGYLIKRTWSTLEARRRGIEPSKAVERKEFRTQLAGLDASTARALRATPREQQALRLLLVTRARDLSLSRALKVDLGDELDQAMLGRYVKKTSCTREYQKARVPECNGSTRPY
jgi:hypothetical protein